MLNLFVITLAVIFERLSERRTTIVQNEMHRKKYHWFWVSYEFNDVIAYLSISLVDILSKDFLSLSQVQELSSSNPTANAASSPLMSGRWTMRWTTEKEILFLVEKGFFGLQCTSVYQVCNSILVCVDHDSSSSEI